MTDAIHCTLVTLNQDLQLNYVHRRLITRWTLVIPAHCALSKSPAMSYVIVVLSRLGVAWGES